MTIPMILIALLTACLVSAQVSHDPVIPKVVNVRIGRNIKTVPQNTAFSQNFPTLGYDIGGRVYQTNQGLVDANLFDTSFYQPSTSCTLYKTDLSLQLIVDQTIASGQTVESIVTADNLGAVFAVVSNQSYSEQEDRKKILRQLITYTFSKTSLAKDDRSAPISSFGLNSSQALDIQLLVIYDRIIITDGVKIVSIDNQNFNNFKQISIDMKGSASYDYEFASQNDLIKFELCHYNKREDKGIVLATWSSILIVYEITENISKATLSFELPPPKGTTFTDAIPDMGKYWGLADGKLMAFRPNQSDYQLVIIQLESSECFSLNKYQSTLHVICREGGVNYVAEYYFNQTFASPYEALKLNRYYTEVDDAKLLFRFGGDYNPKLIIAGDDDLQIHPYAINRQVLLESNYPPRTTELRSLGVQLIHSLPSFSNFTHNYAIGVGSTFIALFLIEEDPPEMECRVPSSSAGQELNILVELNTSSCVANGEWQQLQSICTYYFPFNVYASLVEVDAANHKTIVATVLLLLLAIAILVVGCGFYCRTNMEKAAAEIKKKIEALKNRKGNKPI